MLSEDTRVGFKYNIKISLAHLSAAQLKTWQWFEPHNNTFNIQDSARASFSRNTSKLIKIYIPFLEQI